VAEWVTKFGAETVEEAVAHAGVLLKDPSRMAEEFRKRLEPPSAQAANPDESQQAEPDDADA
jgi:hypothetical protein